MEERESSVASSSDFYGSDTKADTPEVDTAAESVPVKRKADELESAQEKKRKLDSPPPLASEELVPCAGLPPAVWQHVFLFCPLKTLGRLLQVNRPFHSYLTAVRNVSPAKPESGFLRLLKSESIWASARNLHPSRPPKPLPGFSEMQMCQLALSRKCQFCGKTSSFTPGEKIWQKGPGADGVRVVWPFRIRSCGPCLLERCQTDASLLFSTASALRPALPFAVITSDHNYIPAYTLQAATTPANVDITKYYYTPDVDEITNELEHALGLGSAAAEEWRKGLDVRGKDRMKVAENWERWEVKYQWWESHQEPKREPSAAPSATSAHSHLRRSPSQPAKQHLSPVIHAPVPATAAPPHVQSRPTTIPPPAFTPHPVPAMGGQPSRGERNLHDANEAKANRKLEIERRSQLLDPPIPPNVLRHMESFKAAIQISQPMSDYAWNMLQPRLLAQLPAAQQAEIDYVSRVGSLTTRATDRRQQDASLKDVKDVLDREWEEAQRPVRERLSAIADEFINRDWDHGRAVTFENSPKFAVDLLMYVRRKFYAEFSQDGPSPLSQAAGSANDVNPARPKLVLENMKWVYDNKLKPLTEQHRKELFLCYGNGCEGNNRFYGFEGVIQHYGAKHTSTFSSGNVVVAWRDAEWPEETPFHPDPISVKLNYANPAPSAFSSYYGGYPRAGTSTPHMQSHPPQASPVPYGYGGQYNGPFAPPHVPQQATTGYDFAHPFSAPADAYFHQGMGPPGPGPGPHTGNHGYVASPGLTNVTTVPMPLTGAQPPLAGTNGPSAPNHSGGGEYHTNLYDKQVSSIVAAIQDVWKQTAGVKDFPNSLRVYVVLHRVISKFHIEFSHEPTLRHFIDAFSNHEIARALKNAPGLSCKSCQSELSRLPPGGYSSRSEERRTFTVSTLLSHFQSQHDGPQHAVYRSGHPPVLDWKEDMIELPSDRFISGLIHAPGMDDDKLHTLATVFPGLFPTPLPRIGVISDNGVTSPAHSTSKDSAGGTHLGGTPGVTTGKSAGSSAASPYTDSSRQLQPGEDEYDPQRPALRELATTRPDGMLQAYEGHASSDHWARYYEESRYYLPRDANDHYDPRSREYVDLPPNSRMVRGPGPAIEEYPGRRAVYRNHEDYYNPSPGDVIYTHPRAGHQPRGYGFPSHEERYYENDRPRTGYRLVREPNPREHSPLRGHAAAERFLEEFEPPQPMTGTAPELDMASTAAFNPGTDADPETGRRYTPSPNLQAENDQSDQSRSIAAAHHTAPSTASNGSRYDDRRPAGRPVPTPESGLRRAGPHRRRDRHNDYIPARYYRSAREETNPRGVSLGRTQNKRYERYAEQRRRIDQQETPQPNLDGAYDPPYSRDASVDNAYLEEPHPAPLRAAPREYVPVQDRLPAHSPPEYRYVGSPERARGPPPVYVDEYGYEIIRVPRDPRGPARGPYPPARYYEDHEPTPLPYHPYDRRPPRRNGQPHEYVYYEEPESLPPPSARRPAFEPESGEPPYERPPPEIKLESLPAPPIPDVP